MKSIIVILTIFTSISCSGQSFAPLDSAIFNSITDSIYLKDLAFYSVSYTNKDDIESMITSSDTWYRKRFPVFFSHLDNNDKWKQLLLNLDNDTSVTHHEQITNAKFNDLVIYDEDDLKSYRDSSGFNWTEYRKLSPSPEGFFQISKVHLSENKDIGVVKICRYNDALAADSCLLLLEKKNGTWAVVSSMLLWLS
ncbi:MAG: hypothetical protein P8H59_02460 [Flavobacteriales bacterium]|nr:hypothetical protein [Flavobacteriales bacterium]MDG1779788.1 hypothetical protein [Flavobacteriales bacterium]MDG2246852.1 hypothetical protein [Flavobacteriales bacterium]